MALDGEDWSLVVDVGDVVVLVSSRGYIQNDYNCNTGRRYLGSSTSINFAICNIDHDVNYPTHVSRIE